MGGEGGRKLISLGYQEKLTRLNMPSFSVQIILAGASEDKCADIFDK